MLLTPTQSSKSLIVHPVTHEVFEVPDSILHDDKKNPIFIDWDDFQQIASQGRVTAEAFVGLLKKRNEPLVASQIFVVKLKTTEGSDFCWASRMATCPPEISSGPIGGEFIWIWKLSKSYNAWVSRQERLRKHLNVSNCAIDIYPPSLKYTPNCHGFRLGPSDVNGCKKMPIEELAPSQRFLLSCLKPQESNFERRCVHDRWTETLKNRIDVAQANFNDKTLLQVSGKTCENWTVRQRINLLSATGAPIEHRTKRHKIEELPSSSNIALHNIFFKQKTTMMVTRSSNDVYAGIKNGIQKWDAVMIALRQQRGAALPHDLLIRILTIATNDAMLESAKTLRSHVATMRLVSKNVAATVDSFVGIQLTNVFTDTQVMVKRGTLNPVTVGHRIRQLGLIPLNLMTNVLSPKHELRRVEGWTLPSAPHLVPSFKQYLEMRQAQETMIASTSKPSRDNPIEKYTTIMSTIKIMDTRKIANVEAFNEWQKLINLTNRELSDAKVSLLDSLGH